jgi:hypothetical protein
MKTWFLGLFSGPDTRSDEMATLTILGVVWWLAMGSYAILLAHQPFGPETYANGLSTILFAAAAGMGLKAKLGG